MFLLPPTSCEHTLSLTHLNALLGTARVNGESQKGNLKPFMSFMPILLLTKCAAGTLYLDAPCYHTLTQVDLLSPCTHKCFCHYFKVKVLNYFPVFRNTGYRALLLFPSKFYSIINFLYFLKWLTYSVNQILLFFYCGTSRYAIYKNNCEARTYCSPLPKFKLWWIFFFM